jgi:dienelactone hydrolase
MWLFRLVCVSIIVAGLPAAAQSVEKCRRAEAIVNLRDADHKYTRDYICGKSYNCERISAAFLTYAVASAAAYRDLKLNASLHDVAATESVSKYDRIMRLEHLDSRWKLIHVFDDNKYSGLVFHVYERITSESKRVDLLFAFRGTEYKSGSKDAWDSSDRWANFSWVTSLWPWGDQYRIARQKVSEVLNGVRSKHSSQSISITATGHSLGGGLAQHVADHFPCFSAVAFNPSPVTRTLLNLPWSHNPHVVIIREKGDLVSTPTVLASSSSDGMQIYGLEVKREDENQHEIDVFANSMARIATCCIQRDRLRTVDPNLADCQAWRRSYRGADTKVAIEQATSFFCSHNQALKANDKGAATGFNYPIYDGARLNSPCDFSSRAGKHECLRID